MTLTRRSSVVSITIVATLVAVVGYAVYFDHKRRNDVEFRKQLRKQQKKVHRSTTAKEESASMSTERIREALITLRAEPIPKTGAEQERVFQESVARAEELCARGEKEHFNAAVSFFRALRVYPNPVELIMVYQRMVPEPVMKIIMDLYSFEVNPTFSNAQSVPGSVLSDTGSQQATSSSSQRSGPPSETSSQEWENLTDPGRTSA